MVGEVGLQSPITQTTEPPIDMSTLVPVERLWELYDYSPFTGALISRRLNRDLKPNLDINGYRTVRIIHNGATRSYRQAIVIYAWCTGAWPTSELDHRDWNRSKNRFHNLRTCTRRENVHNSSLFKGGYAYDTFTGRYVARIQVEGKRRYLGRFSSKAEAQQAYKDALMELEGPSRRAPRPLREGFRTTCPGAHTAQSSAIRLY